MPPCAAWNRSSRFETGVNRLSDALTAAIKQKALDLGFHKVGIVAIADFDLSPDLDPSGPAALQRWLDQGYQADMAWMANPKRQDIRQVLPSATSLICLALNYYSPQPRSDEPGHGKISRYGWGRDYHRILTQKLKAFHRWLEAEQEQLRALAATDASAIDLPKSGLPESDGPESDLPEPSLPESDLPKIEFPETILSRFYADTGPVQDKLWAQRAGLGWVAKNSNLITRDYGSWVFLGELITNLPLSPDPPHTSHCGSCTRCIEACPTGAIAEPFVVDANRCIAYHTIESKAEEIPEAIANHLQGWVAGCDICQDVCPWNQRFAQPTDEPGFEPYPWNINPNLADLAQLSEADWQQRFPASALRRIKPQQWQRNAQANLQATQVQVQAQD